MKYQEIGFRALYQNFAVLSLNEERKESMEGYPGIEKANCALVYGYVDHQAGLTLDVIAAGKRSGTRQQFFDAPEDVRFFIRIDAAEDEDILLLDDSAGKISSNYAQKLEMIRSVYNADEELAKTREMDFLDDSRDPCYPDDVRVYLTKDGCAPEICWTRMTGLGDHWLMGILLNEPDQNFGYHEGEQIAFFTDETEDGRIICFTDMNPTCPVKPEELEDGSMLREAISEFYANRTQERMIRIMELLRDSHVWLPCTHGTDSENEQMIPDILQNEDGLFLPAFITEDDMGEYGEKFTRVRKHFLEVIALAECNPDIKGIVINAFTEPWVLDREIFDLVENCKSSLI